MHLMQFLSGIEIEFKRNFQSLLRNEKREDIKLEDCLYRGLMRCGTGDELAAGCAKSQMFHDAAQATM